MELISFRIHEVDFHFAIYYLLVSHACNIRVCAPMLPEKSLYYESPREDGNGRQREREKDERNVRKTNNFYILLVNFNPTHTLAPSPFTLMVPPSSYSRYFMYVQR
jgi:hypothetical protein